MTLHMKKYSDGDPQRQQLRAWKTAEAKAQQ